MYICYICMERAWHLPQISQHVTTSHSLPLQGSPSILGHVCWSKLHYLSSKNSEERCCFDSDNVGELYLIFMYIDMYIYIYINVPSISSTYPISHYQPWALPCKITMFHGGSSMVDHEEGRSQEPDAILFTPKKMDQFFLMVILFIPKIEDHIDSVLIHIRFSTFSGEVSTVSTFSRCCVVVVVAVVVGRKQASAAKRRGG